MAKSAFLTSEACEKAFASTARKCADIITGKNLHVALINPVLTVEQVDSFAMAKDWESIFIWERSFGEAPEKNSPYVAFARLKAIEAFRHEDNLMGVWANRPWALRSGSVAWFGGSYNDGLAAGVSGLSEEEDEDFCGEFLFKLANVLIKSASWPTPTTRREQIRAWGGFLP